MAPVPKFRRPIGDVAHQSEDVCGMQWPLRSPLQHMLHSLHPVSCKTVYPRCMHRSVTVQEGALPSAAVLETPRVNQPAGVTYLPQPHFQHLLPLPRCRPQCPGQRTGVERSRRVVAARQPLGAGLEASAGLPGHMEGAPASSGVPWTPLEGASHAVSAPARTL